MKNREGSMTIQERQVALPLDIDHDPQCAEKGTQTVYWADWGNAMPVRKCPGCTYIRGYQDGMMQKVAQQQAKAIKGENLC